MQHEKGRQARIAFLIVVAVLAIVLAVLEAFAWLTPPSERSGPAASLECDDQSLGPVPASSIEWPWTAPIRRVDDALATKNTAEALRALHQAHVLALGSRRWDGMVAVGDAARRIGQSVRAPRLYDARARHAYLVAFFRARHERSLEGVVRVGEAFSALGDLDVVEQCLHVARDLLARHPDEAARVRVLALEQRLTDRSFAAGPVTVEPF
jgi:hypothetical protein